VAGDDEVERNPHDHVERERRIRFSRRAQQRGGEVVALVHLVALG
jgi:hypothetical protein